MEAKYQFLAAKIKELMDLCNFNFDYDLKGQHDQGHLKDTSSRHTTKQSVPILMQNWTQKNSYTEENQVIPNN